jgi:hypothetical protein
LISNAVWKGARLKDLLTQVGVKGNAHYLQLDSFDGMEVDGEGVVAQIIVRLPLTALPERGTIISERPNDCAGAWLNQAERSVAPQCARYADDGKT